MMPTEAANSSVWDRVIVPPPACGDGTANSAVAIRALSVPFMGSLAVCIFREDFIRADHNATTEMI
ncbi:hypothetical protein [Mesorhizobium sp. B2-8-9]|uniref:hypothetical protein n=1 Tax=Mesorhizobium sp. B2-8-9 TaxID=2589899 RepID=UPI001FEFFA04|nr:hypothetical protein [Mesorhizobium sp. B2-8-9]